MNGNETAPQQPGQEPRLEFKPVVKGIGYCLLAAAVLASGYVTFHLGYQQGYGEASASGKVSEALNSAAVQNLTSFMQSSAASDEELEAMVRNPDAALAWIKDVQIRREAEWLLVQSLIERGRVEHGVKLFSALFLRVPKDGVWARRSLGVGDALYASGHAAEAQGFYSYAADVFAASGAADERTVALSRMAAAAIAACKDQAELQDKLAGILREAARLGPAAEPLRVGLAVYLGRAARTKGDEASAKRYLDCALQVAESADEAQMSPAARVGCGAAFLEKGDREKAQRMLQEGERALGHSPEDTLCRVFALRDLAELAEQRGEHQAALGLLNRTEGVAEGNVPRSDFFWPCLYDQRGWVQLLAGQSAAAEDDFSKALASARLPALRAQSLEGAGRCKLALEQANDAARLFTECLNLRTASLPADKDSLARVWILLAQAYEPRNKPEQVAAAYGQALSLLPQDAANHRTAAFGYAKSLCDAGLWKDSLDAWNALLPLVAGDPDDLAEVQEGISACHARLSITPEPQEAAAPAPTKPAAPRTGRSPRNNRRHR